MAPANSVSAGSGRCAAASVRTMLANNTASVASDLAPRKAGRVVADPPARHHTTIGVDHRDVVMGRGPVDSAVQIQILTPSITQPVTGLDGVTRRPNRGTPRSVISLAVRDSSTPQDLVLSKSSKLANNHREVDPAAGSSNAIPPPKTMICRQARRSFIRRRTPGKTRNHPTADHTGIALVDTTSNQPLLND